MSATKRLQFVDAMKGLAILCIVLYHLLLPSGFKSKFDLFVGPFLLMFFCLSGYFYSPGKRTYGQSLVTRLKGLMIPFVIYSVIFWVIGTIYHMIANQLTMFEALCCLRNFFGGCIWNRTIQNAFNWDYHHLGSLYMFLADFWFLLALMFAFILFLAFADWALKSHVKTLITIAVLIGVEAVLLHFNVVLPYNIQNTPYFAMLLLLGAYMRKADLFALCEKKFNVLVNWIVGAVLLIGGIVWALQLESLGNLFRGTFGENQVLSMLAATGSSVLFILGLGILLRRVELTGIKLTPLSYLGEHSLHIFIYHTFFAFFISKFTGILLQSDFKDAVPTAGNHALSVLLIVLCIALPLGIELVQRKITMKIKAKKAN